jgi:hypothetical protein
MAVKKVILPEKPTLRWFKPDGSTDEGDLLFKFDHTGSVSFEAMYESIAYYNAQFRRENDSSTFSAGGNDGLAPSVSRLQQFTITEEQHAHFRELVNMTSAKRLLAGVCGYRCGDCGCDGSSTESDSEEDEVESEDESDDVPIRTTRSRRQVKPNVRHRPMRSAAHVLTSRKRKVEAARARDEEEQEVDEAPLLVGKRARKGE